MRGFLFAMVFGLMSSAVQAQNAPVWHIESYAGCESDGEGLVLRLGTPFQNPVQFDAHCYPLPGAPYAIVDIETQVDGFERGQAVQFLLSSRDHNLGLSAHVVRRDLYLTGVRLLVGLDAPFWQALADSDILIAGVLGRQSQPLRLDGARGPVHRFLQACHEMSLGNPERFRQDAETPDAHAHVEADGACGLWIRFN